MTEVWNPVTEKFGARRRDFRNAGHVDPSPWRSPCPSASASPFFSPNSARLHCAGPIGIAIELLAGIPSIIYGIWGLFVFAPFLQQHVQPALIALFGARPRAVVDLRRASLWHRHADRRADPGDHGPAVRHLDFARRVRDRAADVEGIGLRHRLHDMGGRQQYRDPLHARRRHRRRHARSSGARSAKRWR